MRAGGNDLAHSDISICRGALKSCSTAQRGVAHMSAPSGLPKMAPRNFIVLLLALLAATAACASLPAISTASATAAAHSSTGATAAENLAIAVGNLAHRRMLGLRLRPPCFIQRTCFKCKRGHRSHIRTCRRRKRKCVQWGSRACVQRRFGMCRRWAEPGWSGPRIARCRRWRSQCVVWSWSWNSKGCKRFKCFRRRCF